MVKLATVESGSIVPLPETAEMINCGNDEEGKVITEKTWLIIDGGSITLTDEHGYQKIQTFTNHKLELDEKSNYKEKPLFFSKLHYALAIRFQNTIGFFRYYLGAVFQTIFRKSHISDNDLACFDSYIAKRVLPLIKAYKKKYLEGGCLAANELIDLPCGGISGEKKEWTAVIDEIIFSLRWSFEIDMLVDTPKKIAFFKDYYGRYISYEDGWDKHNRQFDDAARRASGGFELFGRFFVRKTAGPDYGLINLNKSLAKRVLPKVKAYREMFLKRHKDYAAITNALLELRQEESIDTNKELLANIDEIIYAMRWCLEVDMFNETPEKIAFFKEYYGQYVSPDDEDKHIEQYDDSLYRAKRGFMSLGWFISLCNHCTIWHDADPQQEKT